MRRLRLDDCFLVADSDAVRRRDDTIRSLQGELQERSAWALALDAEVADLGSRLLSIQRELEERTQWAQEVVQESERRGRSILDLQRELESRTVWARDIEAESKARQTSLEELQAQLDRGDGPLSPDPVQPVPPAGVAQPTALEPDSARELRALIAWQSESLRLQRRREVALESRLERLEAHSSELAQDVDALRFSPNALLRRWRQQRLANEAMSAQLSALEGALSPTRYVLEMLWASRLWRAYARLRRTAESVPLIRRLRGGRPSVDLWAHGREQLDRAVTPHMPGNGVASRRALIVDHRLPAPDEDAASLRTLAMIALLREQGFAVTFVPANLHASTPHVGLLLARGVEVPAAPRWTSIRDFLAQRGSEFDLAIVCRLHIAREYFDIVRALCPRARLIFDTVDLQHLRLARRAQVEQDAAMASEASRLRDEELELASCADATIVVSEFEERLLHESMPRLDVRLLSLIYDAADAAHDFEHRAGIYFVGGFEHPPNVDGMRWFLREVFPEVCRLLPDVRLSIAGSKMPEGLAAPDHPRITNCGHLADLGGLLTGCRLSIAPLRYGAGVKGKVLQSLAAGVPCVATSAAAEGIGLSGELAVLVADDPKAMAHRIVRLHEDSALWRRASRLGRELVRARFSTEVARSALVDLLRDLGLAEATRS
jgi:glycosyltransferase involved in cell wall biosynthesis